MAESAFSSFHRFPARSMGALRILRTAARTAHVLKPPGRPHPDPTSAGVRIRWAADRLPRWIGDRVIGVGDACFIDVHEAEAGRIEPQREADGGAGDDLDVLVLDPVVQMAVAAEYEIDVVVGQDVQEREAAFDRDVPEGVALVRCCLLYTSDAADE